MKPSRLFAAAAVSMCLGLPAGGAMAQGLSTATRTIDVMNTIWGKHAGMRANHAKGVVVEGSFTPTPAAAALSKATIFSGPPVQVTVRFSNSTGLPALPDGSPDANPHGMAIKFYDVNGDVDVVTNSLAFFPVATGEDFLALLTALAESGPDAPKPTKADQFLAAHPTVAKAFGTVSTPVSFARETYNGVDAFVFVNAEGKRQAFRFQFVPVAGTEHMTAAEAAKQPPDFLVDELPKRLSAEAVAFHVIAQLADAEDQTRDPTQPWPADRKRVDMGTITLTRAASDNVRAQRELRFLPNRLTPGIEV